MQVIAGHAMWSAQDALVLKWVALLVSGLLPDHHRCEHGKGRGIFYSRRRLSQALVEHDYAFALRTDIRGYYQHIKRDQVMSIVSAHVPSPVLRSLIAQYLHYSVEDGGEFHTPEMGIGRGCALSPLIGSALLYHVDEHFCRVDDIYYARYMDDFIILTRTRWRLRQLVRELNVFLSKGGFSQHPDKTWIGRLSRGFDWLGGWWTQQGLVGVSPRSLELHRVRCLRLYEQGLRLGLSASENATRLQQYRTRWNKIMG
ncbi:reverse transcriptase domain-containing protein [Aeromonas piscicola]|uniref:reverse transcriptase domain-containing protein n=1 Tax=Aeromonas piscicola TaxID=600645 RepID=UPI001ADFCCA0|nr:reverse transcriptase domain-containing protein [Aeromonas piscicola]